MQHTLYGKCNNAGVLSTSRALGVERYLDALYSGSQLCINQARWHPTINKACAATKKECVPWQQKSGIIMNEKATRARKKEIIDTMVHIYCRGQRHVMAKETLCADCSRLLEYAKQRVDTCMHAQEKLFCSKCPIRCYKPEMRERVRAVMQYAGPRMLWHSPMTALKHMIASLK